MSAMQSAEGRSRIQTLAWPDQHSGSLNNWEESAAFVITNDICK